MGGKGDRGGSGSLIQPQQVFAEIKRYSSLMGRRNIAAALQTEKETLAKQVDKHLDSVQVRPTPRPPLLRHICRQYACGGGQIAANVLCTGC